MGRATYKAKKKGDQKMSSPDRDAVSVLEGPGPEVGGPSGGGGHSSSDSEAHLVSPKEAEAELTTQNSSEKKKK